MAVLVDLADVHGYRRGLITVVPGPHPHLQLSRVASLSEFTRISEEHPVHRIHER